VIRSYFWGHLVPP